MKEKRDGDPRGFDVERVHELGEDLNVAVGEFLERHPDTTPEEIRAALRASEEAPETDGTWSPFRPLPLATSAVGPARRSELSRLWRWLSSVVLPKGRWRG